MDRLTLYWGAFCLVVAAVYIFLIAGPEKTFWCEGPGWTVQVSESELKRPALLVVGTLPDGRRVALPKAHIRECKIVAE